MSLRKTLGLSLALLVISTTAFAKTVQVAHPAKPHSNKAPGSKARSAKARSRTRLVSAADTKLFNAHVFGAKAFSLGTLRVTATAPAIGRNVKTNKPALLAANRQKRRAAPEPARLLARTSKRLVERGRRVARAERLRAGGHERAVAFAHRGPLVRDAVFSGRYAGRSIVHDADYAPPRPGLLADGPRQVGNAAWYGGDRIGRRTASGTPLDTIHATAAHRSLPLNSLARVTNLRNGRSVVVTVNDRGPVSHGFIIDLSPKAAEDLAMVSAGVAPVSVEPVIEQSASLR